MNIIDQSKITLAELFTSTWSTFKENMFSIIMVNLITSIPLYTLNYLLSTIKGELLIEFAFGSILPILLTLVAGISSLATVHIVVNSCSGKPPVTVKQSLFMAYERWGESITAGILQFIIIFGLMLLIIIPGLVWTIYYMFFYQVIALTDLKGKNALNYSKYIVSGNWWKVLGNTLALSLVPDIIYFSIYFYYRHLISINPDLTGLIILTGTISSILFCFVNVGITILYLNLQSNKTYVKEKNTYEKVNALVNGNSATDCQMDEDEVVNESLDKTDEFQDAEETDVNDDMPRCSTCGMKVESGKLICPMCHSVMRK